jgi:hypothetical protein
MGLAQMVDRNCPSLDLKRSIFIGTSYRDTHVGHVGGPGQAMKTGLGWATRCKVKGVGRAFVHDDGLNRARPMPEVGLCRAVRAVEWGWGRS